MRWWPIPVILLAFAASAHAQGWIDPVRPMPQFAVHKLRTNVVVHVTGRVASVEVEEYFRNDGPALGEADYLYPLPGEAVFSNFSLFQGDRELRGETMDAAHARAIYEEIVRRKRDPALIELAGHGLLRARVFPIATGETRRITLRYTQLLSRAGEALQFKYATSPRQPRGVPVSFRLIADDARSFGMPFSPTQEVRSQRAENRLTVTPVGELSGDFDVFLPLTRAAVGVALTTHRPDSEDGFFMLTLSPGQVEERVVPRDVTVVLDVSGSMSGEKIEQARAALRGLLQTLGASDRFRLIAFSDQVRTFSNEWLSASVEQKRAAQQWVDGLHADGGTNLAGALQEAFTISSPDVRLPFVILITDGLPSVGEQNPERIADRVENARGRARVFAFGVGYDVNTYLLDRLSAAARGATQYVRPGESVERPVVGLANKIRFPVLTDLRIGNTPVEFAEAYPRQLPDLFADEELVIVGRYHGSGRGAVTISGSRSGRSQTFSTVADFRDHQLDNDFIPRIWAARKVGYLSQQLRLNGNNSETLEQLRTTALRYGILSEYTSYLVQEPGMVAGELHGLGEQRQLAPMSATGAVAVAAAEASRVHREAKTLAQVAPPAFMLDENARADLRTVAGRRFRQQNGIWTDMMFRTDQSDVIRIEPFSDAYFALLRALPELTPYWKALPNVLVAGRHVSLETGAGGVKQLDAARVAEIVKRFRI